MRSPQFIACALCYVALFTGCSKPPPPPDGTSGVRGVCLLPAEPPDEAGKVPDRQPWAELDVHATLVNSPDADYKTKFSTHSAADGTFRLELNPGEYIVGVYDSTLLRNKMLSPMHVKVEPGRFTEVVIDYNKLNVRALPDR
jgi:hypothetical protein